jgi:hypothetical protein
MAFASILKIDGWGNQHYPVLSGARGSSPSPWGGLRALFFLGRRVVARGPNGAANGYCSPREFQQIRNYDTSRTHRGTKTSLLSELQSIVEELSKSKITTLLKLTCAELRGERCPSTILQLKDL